MKIKCQIASLLFVIMAFAVQPLVASGQASVPKYEMTVSKPFYDQIVLLDSIFFSAYNHCKMKVMDSLLSADLEFYHDKGGFSNSKQQTLDALQQNICGKVTRELLPGSIEVYEIKDYGAIEIGFHGFHNNQEKEPDETHFSKFINIWHNDNGQWLLKRIVSLH